MSGLIKAGQVELANAASQGNHAVRKDEFDAQVRNNTPMTFLALDLSKDFLGSTITDRGLIFLAVDLKQEVDPYTAEIIFNPAGQAAVILKVKMNNQEGVTLSLSDGTSSFFTFETDASDDEVSFIFMFDEAEWRRFQ